MSTILAIETSGALCSLAIYAGNRWIEDTQNVERLHNRVVLENLDRLTVEAGVERRAFDMVAFGAGPGSFTGVRIAAAVAQGVAFACDAGVVPVASSLALAAAAARQAEQTAGVRLLTVTRSRRDAYYLAGYDLTTAGVVPVLSDRLHQGEGPPEELLDPSWAGTGHRPPWWPVERRFLDGIVVSAVTVGELAMAAREHARAPEGALPIYVSGDSPWKPMGS